MLNCYICNNDFDLKYFPEEHIIPNSLGGRLVSRKLICTKCNSKFGEEIDLQWKQIPLGTYFNVKRDRGKSGKIRGQTESGLKISFDNTFTPFLIEPLIEKDKSGKIKRIVAHNKGALKSILKKEKAANPELDLDELEKKISGKEIEFTEPVFPKGYGFGGNKLFGQAVTKIGTNYFMDSGGEKDQIYTAIKYLNNVFNHDGPFAYHYYPKENVHNYLEKEISHILFIKAESDSRMLYCYVELFSCYSFLILLNTFYTGHDFENIYCYDLLNNTSIKDKKINIKLSREELLNIPYTKVDEIKGLEKLHRFYDILGIKYTKRR